MTYNFTYTAEDYVEAQTARRRRRDSRPRQFDPRTEQLRAVAGVLLVAGAVLLIASSAALGWRLSPWWWLVMAALVALAVVLFAPYVRPFSARRVRRWFLSNPQNAIPARITFDENGFTFVTDLWRCRDEWWALTEIRETPNLFLLMDDEPNTFILPKRAFPDDAARDRFRSFVEGRMNHNAAADAARS